MLIVFQSHQQDLAPLGQHTQHVVDVVTAMVGAQSHQGTPVERGGHAG